MALLLHEQLIVLNDWISYAKLTKVQTLSYSILANKFGHIHQETTFHSVCTGLLRNGCYDMFKNFAAGSGPEHVYWHKSSTKHQMKPQQWVKEDTFTIF